MIKKKIFKIPSEISKARSYQLELIELLTSLGFDDKLVIYQELDRDPGSPRYPGTIEVYIRTKDDSLINSLKIIT